MIKPTGEFISISDQFSTAIRAKIDQAAREFLEDDVLDPWVPVSHGYIYNLLVMNISSLYGELPGPVIAMIEMSAWVVGERVQQLRNEQ